MCEALGSIPTTTQNNLNSSECGTSIQAKIFGFYTSTEVKRYSLLFGDDLRNMGYSGVASVGLEVKISGDTIVHRRS